MSLALLLVTPGASPGRTAVLAMLRLNLGDQGTTFQASVPGDGLTTRFDLPYELIEGSGLSVFTLNSGVQTFLSPGTPPAAGQYSLQALQGTVVLGTALASTAVLYVTGIYYNKYLTADLGTFLDAAFLQQTAGRTVTFDTLPAIEQYPLSILATIEALWGEIAESANEVDVSTPEGMHIPAAQRFQQLLQAIQTLQTQYDAIASALNIGIHRIQMFNLRRVSRTTGRLVPVYIAQEYDDTTPPIRVYPPIDSGTLGPGDIGYGGY